MDAGLTGALIGIGVMSCLALTAVLNEKGSRFLERCKHTLKEYRQQKQRQPLLPLTRDNPILVRIPSKQFQMKDLLSK